QSCGKLLVTLEGFTVWIDDQLPAIAIEDEHVAGPDMRGSVTEADDSRQIHRARKNRDVACRAARIGREAEQFVTAKENSIGRCKEFGYDDGRTIELRDQFVFLEQMPQQSFFDIDNVIGAFAEERVIAGG